MPVRSERGDNADQNVTESWLFEIQNRRPHTRNNPILAMVEWPTLLTGCRASVARICHDDDTSASLHNDCIGLARGSGPGATAVPATGAAAQCGYDGVE